MLAAIAFLSTATASAGGVPSAPMYTRGYVRQPTPAGTGVKTVDISDIDVMATPDAVDWSTQGALTPVKDQGQCGGCWAFSTVEGVESAVWKATGKLPQPLSTEQLIDCEHRDLGCNGGDIPEAVRYLEKNGLDSNADYPDDSSKSGHTKKCTWGGKSVVKVTGMSYAVPQCTRGSCKDTNEEKLAAAVAQYGPISICINSGDRQPGDWMKYKGGVLQKSCAAKASLIDHCVQLVGYNKTATPPWWKIRNSWGTDWGEKGFIRIEYNNENMCCVGCEAVVIEATTANTTRTLV